MRKYLLILVALFALLLAACETAAPAGDAAAEPAEDTAAVETTDDMTATDEMTDTTMADGAMMEVNPLEVEGDIVLAGSSDGLPAGRSPGASL